MSRQDLAADRALVPLSWPRAALNALWALAVGLLLFLLLLPVVGCASARPITSEHPGVVIERLFEPARAPLPARWMVAIQTDAHLTVVEVDADSWAELAPGTEVVLIGSLSPLGWKGPVQIRVGHASKPKEAPRSAA